MFQISLVGLLSDIYIIKYLDSSSLHFVLYEINCWECLFMNLIAATESIFQTVRGD